MAKEEQFLEEPDMDGSVSEGLEEEESTIPANAGEDKLVIAKSEDTGVRALRILTALVLVGVAVTVCVVVYKQTQANEQENFEQGFHEHGGKLMSGFVVAMKSRVGIVEGFAMDLTSTVNDPNTNVSWPYYMPHDYSRRAHHVCKLAQIGMLAVLPKVETLQLPTWNAYINQRKENWTREALAYQQQEVDKLQFLPTMMKLIDGKVEVEDGPGPYFPITWMYPAAGFPSYINTNLYGNPTGARIQMNEALNSTTMSFARSTEFMDGPKPESLVYRESGKYFPGYDGGPYFPWYYAVYDSYQSQTKKVVALLGGYTLWTSYFTGILPDATPGLVLILENKCNQTFTMQIEGEQANILSKGDHHDTKYDDLAMSVTVDSIFGQQDENDNEEEYGTFSPKANVGKCHYRIRIYPSQEFEDSYYTNAPLIFTVTLASVFLFTCMVFLAFDYFVEQRQKAVMKSALQSGQLVSSLFPEEVRKQLYQEEEAKAKAKEQEKGWRTASTAGGDTISGAASDGLTAKQAIAHYYEDTTIFFMDLSGFTKWSSTRTPAEVFELLEALYGQFDRVAAKLNVFKVETIGDCYVAVTGLPEAQPDHALIMTKFAQTCMRKIHPVLVSLAPTLGEDTLNLEMRVGLHSGPVTGGVLRGKKARFQLFGDSVNTASRMESNGQPGRIHVSESTAEELRKHGKDEWLTVREDKITAKGKGLMTTYWVNPKAGGATTTRTGSVASTRSSVSQRGDIPSSESIDLESGPAPAADNIEELHSVDV
ncbi:Receptor-type guanylate cyclase gcy [Seminavis robusta]|uniref:Receptor-type guanylate cyclase gcy n=1 Tax=Seminavis robusta TaxID=568900 RepID=A0A9N8F299_9STRA|nr:Receptor-type guanylate cyclase gcy [Seminavis robusta]|eukprot:Sro3434_g348000.1 Receptor-type guanylate cyclase gcy (765) ;mRNA; r:1903-4656